jgi:HK97 family phage major capsid protein
MRKHLMAGEISQLSHDEATTHLNHVREEINEIHVQAGPEGDYLRVSSVPGTVDEKLAAVNRLVEERDALAAHIAKIENAQLKGRINQSEWLRSQGLAPELGDIEAAAQTAHVRGQAFNIRHFLDQHAGYREFRKSPQGSLTIEIPGLNVRNLITTTEYSPQAQRDSTVPLGVEMSMIADLMAESPITANEVEYYRQTVLSDTAAETAEGDDAPEDTFTWELASDHVRDITDFVPVSRDALADSTELEGLLRNDLSYSIVHRENRQLLAGDGVGVNLLGIMNRGGDLQTYAKVAGEPNVDAIYEGIQRVRGSNGAGFADPTAVILHPQDWKSIRLMREVGGQYIWGSPSVPGAETLFGLTVRQTTVMPLHTALVGAFRPFAEIKRRSGLMLEVSTEHLDYFRKRIAAVMAVERLALKVTRRSAFCTVTNLS